MKKAALVLVFILIGVAGYFAWLADESTTEKPVPVITVMDILSASDLAEGVKQAVQAGDEAAIARWLEKGRDVGEEAGLSKQDMAYLNSDQARDYVVFNAKRDLFNEAFEQRYANLESIDDLKQRYPQANDQFAKADAVIEKRDAIIEQIAQTLAQGEAVTEAHRVKARQLWQERYHTRQSEQRE